MASALFNKGTTTGAKAQNEEWLGSDVDIGVRANRSLRLILQIGLTSADAVVEVTFDGGSTWLALNSGSDLTADNLFTFDIFVKQTDLVNFRTPTVGGTTVQNFLVTADLDA